MYTSIFRLFAGVLLLHVVRATSCSNGSGSLFQQLTSDVIFTAKFLTLLHFFPALIKSLSALSFGDGTSGERASGVYNLDHAILNVKISEHGMWMNMGYWRDSETKDFSTACPALLLRVFRAAGLFKQQIRDEESTSIELLDIGIGCGDQTKFIASLSSDEGTSATGLSDSKLVFPRLASYVGITNDHLQWKYAELNARSTHKPSSSAEINIFCADGSNPAAWSKEIQSALGLGWNFHNSESQASNKYTDTINVQTSSIKHHPPPTERWLLGLDSLYHLSPSRNPLFSFAHHSSASIAAFDLLLPQDYAFTTTYIQRILLYLICVALGTPRSNLVTPTDYRAQLVRAGYRDEDISIEDISVDVFGPLAEFLQRRDAELQRVGIKGGIGKFRVASRVFGWWARTGIVRGCVVVAKARSE